MVEQQDSYSSAMSSRHVEKEDLVELNAESALRSVVEKPNVSDASADERLSQGKKRPRAEPCYGWH